MTRDYKWRQRGRRGYRLLHCVASHKLECHLERIIWGCAALRHQEMNLLNHFWCIQTIHVDYLGENITLKSSFSFSKLLQIDETHLLWDLQLSVSQSSTQICLLYSEIKPSEGWMHAISILYVGGIKISLCDSPRDTLWRGRAACCSLISEWVPRKTKHYLNMQHHPGLWDID